MIDEQRTGARGARWLTNLVIAGAVSTLVMGATVTIAGAAAPPKPDKTLSFTSATYEVTEGQGLACATVERSVIRGKAPTATFATSAGTATSGVDYSAVDTTISFPKRESLGEVCVPILVDHVTGESDATVGVTLSNPSRGWTIGTQDSATITIHEMAAPSAPTELAASLAYNESGGAYVSLTWAASTGPVDHYVVASSTNSGGTYEDIGTAPGTSFDVTPAPRADTYYVVRALNVDTAVSGNSNEAMSEAYVPGGGLYWANFSSGVIMAANTDGTGVSVLVSGIDSPISVAVRAGYVYWTDSSAGTINRANLSGGDVTALISGQSHPYGLAVDATNIYWTNLTGVDGGSINRASLDGTGVTSLVSGENSPSSVAVDASHIYWTTWNSPGGTIRVSDISGDNKQTLISEQDYPFAIAVDSSHLYWVNEGEINTATGTVNKALLSDTSQRDVLATGQWHPDGLAVDANYVYWANSNGGSINRANLDGTGSSAIVTGTSQPIGVAVIGS